jgi:hypothetical protein
MRGRGWLFPSACAVGAAACLAGCGDDDSSVPFDQIPKSKKLADLTAEERRGACEWAAGIAGRELPPAGTQLNCDGLVVTINAPQCRFESVRPECTATVGQWEVCMPRFFDRLGQDPCLILDLGTSPSDLEAFVDAIPGCEGLGVCATTL